MELDHQDYAQPFCSHQLLALPVDNLSEGIVPSGTLLADGEAPDLVAEKDKDEDHIGSTKRIWEPRPISKNEDEETVNTSLAESICSNKSCGMGMRETKQILQTIPAEMMATETAATVVGEVVNVKRGYIDVQRFAELLLGSMRLASVPIVRPLVPWK